MSLMFDEACGYLQELVEISFHQAYQPDLLVTVVYFESLT